jgi:hypothetical protein
MTAAFLSCQAAMAGLANMAAAISAAEKRSSLLICVSFDCRGRIRVWKLMAHRPDQLKQSAVLQATSFFTLVLRRLLSVDDRHHPTVENGKAMRSRQKRTKWCFAFSMQHLVRPCPIKMVGCVLWYA